ncbi:MAG: methyltransferase, partial [Acidobacteria bacterium]|nr:methyltransferase [Acidobacteriota bacterium]
SLALPAFGAIRQRSIFAYPLSNMAKNYDRDYYDRWYRDPQHRVRTAQDLRRKVAMVVGIAEHVMQRRVRSALDIGCGEGEWGVELGKLRPAIRYLGIDSSEYAVGRFGETRNLRLGSLGEVDEIAGRRSWDLVICSDVLHYVDNDEIEELLPVLALLTEGVAFIDVMTVADQPTGDTDGFRLREGSWYRSRFERAGLVAVGMQCYVGPAMSGAVLELEKWKMENGK